MVEKPRSESSPDPRIIIWIYWSISLLTISVGRAESGAFSTELFIRRKLEIEYSDLLSPKTRWVAEQVPTYCLLYSARSCDLIIWLWSSQGISLLYYCMRDFNAHFSYRITVRVRLSGLLRIIFEPLSLLKIQCVNAEFYGKTQGTDDNPALP